MSVSDAGLNYKIEGQGPKLLLLHPVGLDLTSWDAVVSNLSHDYTILRVDACGHGQSPPAIENWSLDDYANDIHRVLITCKFIPTAVVGLSFGGMLAQTLAINHPEDVSALVVCGCPSTLPQAVREVMMQRAASTEQTGMSGVIEETLQRWFTPGFIERGGAEPTRQRLLSDDVMGWSTAWRAISHLNTQAELWRITIPTLCIAGEHDSAAPPVALETIANCIVGAEFKIIHLAPHMMQIEYPEELSKLLSSFLVIHAV